VLYEVLHLATEAQRGDIVSLVTSIIAVTQIDSEAFIKLPELAGLVDDVKGRSEDEPVTVAV
jgi:hypothetical protein